jgi:hypothetical protein
VVSWTGAAGDLNWDTPGNWSSGALPGAADDVLINQSGITITHNSSTADAVNSLTSQAGLALSGGSLTAAADSSIAGNLTLSGGTLGGASAWTVSGTFAWSAGTLQGVGGQGSLTAAGGMTVVADPNQTLVLDGFRLVNAAGQAADWTAPTGRTWLALYDGATLVNHGAMGLHNGGIFIYSADGTGTLYNDGTLSRDGTGWTEVVVQTLDNEGTLEAVQGEFDLGDPHVITQTLVNGGTITADSGALLSLLGTVTQTATGQFNGAGQVNFGGYGDPHGDLLVAASLGGTYAVTGTTWVAHGSVTVTGTVASLGNLIVSDNRSDSDSATLDLSGASFTAAGRDIASLQMGIQGTLLAAADLAVTGGFTWSAGTLQGVGGQGSLTAAGGMTIAADPNQTLVLDGFRLVNAAGQAADWTAPTGRTYLALYNGATLVNHGAMGLHNGGILIYSGDGTGTLANDGTLRRDGAAWSEVVVHTLTNAGTLEADEGEFDLGDPHVITQTLANSGTITAGSGALISLLGTVTQGATGQFNGAGAVSFGSYGDPYADLTVAASLGGTYAVTGTTRVVRGSVTVTGTVASLGNLVVGGLTNTGPATLDLSGASFTADGHNIASLQLGYQGTLVAAADLAVTGSFAWSGGTLAGSGTLTLQGDSSISGNNTLDGLHLVNQGAVSWTSGNLTVQHGAVLSNAPGATIGSQGNTGWVVLNGGTLAGFGTVNAPVSNDGVVSPGGPGVPGALTINGRYEQNSDGALNIEIAGPVAGSQYDQLNVTVPADLGGTLNVSLLPELGEVCGATFAVVNAAPLYGTFATINGLTQPGGQTLTPAYSASSLTLTASRFASTTTLAASANPTVFGQPATFTATVAAPAGAIDTPTGPVQFQVDGVNAGAPVVLNNGQANLTLSSLAVGSHTITALYAGDGCFYASGGGGLTLTVNPDPTTTAVTTSASPTIPGQPVALTAAVGANAPGAGTPTGSVDFYDTTTATDLGAMPLSGGKAVLTTSALALGSHVISARYGGDGNFLASAGSVTQAVTQSIVILNGTASGALSLSGNAGITIPGNLVVDSTSTTALTESGSAHISAAGIQVVGGASRGGNATWSPAPVTGAASVADPLAGLTAPTGGTAQGSVNLSGTSSLTINPGVYQQISVSGNARLTLNPGVYILAGGGLTVSGNASISGSGVTLYNTESAFPNPGGTYGGITLSGNGAFNLTAPTSGPYAGVVLFQARTNTRAIALSGNAAEGLGGTVYAPAALLYLSGNASLAGPVVVNELALTGNAASTQAVDASDVSGGDAAGQLLAGNLEVYINDPGGLFTADELARIQDAVNAVNAVVAPYGVSVAETTDPTQANVVIDTASTSAVGGYADGILGCYTTTGEITLIQGWNWYVGADPAQVGASQYDFETTVTHELGHALGLGESADPTSAMYGTLAAATAIRTLTTADLHIPYDDGAADAQRAAPVQAVETAGAGLVGKSSLDGAPSARPNPVPGLRGTVAAAGGFRWPGTQDFGLIGNASATALVHAEGTTAGLAELGSTARGGTSLDSRLGENRPAALPATPEQAGSRPGGGELQAPLAASHRAGPGDASGRGVVPVSDDSLGSSSPEDVFWDRFGSAEVDPSDPPVLMPAAVDAALATDWDWEVTDPGYAHRQALALVLVTGGVAAGVHAGHARAAAERNRGPVVGRHPRGR